MDPKINGDDVVVRQGDQLVTLEDRLVAMQKSIRLLWVVIVIQIALQILWAVVGPEEFARIVRQLVETAT